jgi:hypothetical protein
VLSGVGPGDRVALADPKRAGAAGTTGGGAAAAAPAASNAGR